MMLWSGVTRGNVLKGRRLRKVGSHWCRVRMPFDIPSLSSYSNLLVAATWWHRLNWAVRLPFAIPTGVPSATVFCNLATMFPGSSCLQLTASPLLWWLSFSLTCLCHTALSFSNFQHGLFCAALGLDGWLSNVPFEWAVDAELSNESCVPSCFYAWYLKGCLDQQFFFNLKE